jgi:glycosyltransferase involved in cell wall biosynthesis
MKIAQVAPLFESVPPKAYGGTERVISYLTEELVRLGHEVTLFATGDSVTGATLIPTIAESIRWDNRDFSWLTYHAVQMDMVAAMADSFDVLHFHTDYLHFPVARRCRTPHVSTLHGRLDLPTLGMLYAYFNDEPLISISDSQRAPLPWANWQQTIHHGLPHDLYSLETAPGDYFLFVGRISPEKRVDRAIDIAVKSKRQLYVAAKIDKADEAYFNTHIRHLFSHPLVTFVGEVNEREKGELIQHARALLFPIDWPEPFGLVMIEAFSCGTPVIAYANGSVPEIMEDGVTGFVVTNQEEALCAARNIESIDRQGCRAAFERRFTAGHMAGNYLGAYERVIANQAAQ